MTRRKEIQTTALLPGLLLNRSPRTGCVPNVVWAKSFSRSWPEEFTEQSEREFA